jgi:2-isopropylmalate synthase
MTDAERKLWHMLRDRRFAAAKFRRQVPLGPFVADFLSYQHRLVVEADGSQHVDNPADRKRDAWFEENGFRVVRFWNNDILTRPAAVAEELFDTLRAADRPIQERSDGR